MIDRYVYADLMDLLDYFPAVGIIGPRQVGKTTLAKSLVLSIGADAIYLDLENPRDLNVLSDAVLFFESNTDKTIILDEVQRVPELFPILRSMIDQDRRPARFILLGSATPDIIRDASESLAGRIAYRELYPLNLVEIQTTKYPDNTRHWLRGGYPQAFLSATDRRARNWMLNFVRTYMERDLPMLGLQVDVRTIRQLWGMLANTNGDILNYNTISKSLGVSAVTAKKYISFMEDAFLIRLLQPFSSNMRKRIVKSPKVLIRDTGVLHYLMGIDSEDALWRHPQLGNSWEAYCIEQIASILDPEYELFYYRTHHGVECDLVITRGLVKVFAIEIKFSSTPKLTKGMINAFEDIQAEENFVIIPNGISYFLSKNIQVLNINDFIHNTLKNKIGFNYP